ncbi:MAG: carbamoyltransferase HypF [Bacteroidia bacterium]|nr:carbamoyltransferase HypF [Bacteroidia bacterium]NNF82681.1 carbamoyltransferase HypF [Flavobacteriaceae bacterium]NNK70694.1 carbamoyltransferase HypF [Flavobacteriaceae bacterium]
MVKTFKITINGQVQGVGFRPYVYNLATEFSLTGSVSNNEEGVIIYVTGKENNVRDFYSELIKNPPPVSRINDHRIEHSEYKSFPHFKIIPSEKNDKLNLQLTPDFAICQDCSNEISDKSNRRFGYPFTTCVNCGPRWAITKRFPFERHNTSIDSFRMCNDCNSEYTDPSNRRFHSQTNSCSECGIMLELTDNDGKVLEVDNDKIFSRASELISAGKIIAIKNTGGYLLCCDASNKESILELRQRKKRPTKPFAILYPSLESLSSDFVLTPAESKELVSNERPIVIVQMNGYSGDLECESLAPGLNQMGIMLPYSGLLEIFADHHDEPVVATSGNLHGSPILREKNEALDVLGQVADYFIHHNLDILNPQDDSVIKFSKKTAQRIVFRRSRGFAPNHYGHMPSSDKCTLAMGGELKSAMAILPNDFLYISQYLGNLERFEVVSRYEETVRTMVNIFENEPETILVDSHPNYICTNIGRSLATEFQAEIKPIQHHVAHFASVLGEHDLLKRNKPILGVIWDGTGYGDDKQIWGGEFFTYNDHQISRLTHFSYFNWLASDKMSKEPRLSLLTLLSERHYDVIKEKFSEEEFKIYSRLKETNQLKTSSVGRIFDAVASAAGLCDYNTYEGEAAILMENLLDDYEISELSAYEILNEDGHPCGKLLIAEIVEDLLKGNSNKDVFLKFIYTLAKLVFDIARQNSISAIACSGGVFQNSVLVDMLLELGSEEFELFFNVNLAPNDENIPFGQMVYHLNQINA